MRGSIEALPIREAGSGAAAHVAACGCMLCPLSRLEADIQGYPVYRVSIVWTEEGCHLWIVEYVKLCIQTQ
jgi:hypothetical protein